MPADEAMKLVDVHGYVQEISAKDHKNALGISWLLFFGAIIINLIYYKIHPAVPDFTINSDIKLRTHICGTVKNRGK